MDVMRLDAGMTPLELDLPEPPQPWWTVTLALKATGGEPLVDPGLRVPDDIRLRVLEQSVLSMRVPGVDEVEAVANAGRLVRVLLGRWPGMMSASVERAGAKDVPPVR